MTDYLFVNYREFRALAGVADIAADDAMIAERVLAACGGSCSALVLKRYDRILLYRRRDEGVAPDAFRHEPLEPEVIEDATGAGDVFAAGMLAAMTSDDLQLELGTFLGMKMARHKLHHVGDRGYPDFGRISQRFLRDWGAEQEAQLRPRGVFIAHGSSPLWRSVRDYLRDDLGLDVHHFEETPHDSREITAALNDYLRRCSFAVCVLTNEDLMASGANRARQNVVHEAGLFQGRYGFQRAARRGPVRAALQPQRPGPPRLRGAAHRPDLRQPGPPPPPRERARPPCLAPFPAPGTAARSSLGLRRPASSRRPPCHVGGRTFSR